MHGVTSALPLRELTALQDPVCVSCSGGVKRLIDPGVDARPGPVVKITFRISVSAYGLQQSSHFHGLSWFHTTLAPGWPRVSYHFEKAAETRSPSIVMPFHAPQWW